MFHPLNFCAKFYAGFWIGGLGFGDSPEERCSILDAAVVRILFFTQ